MRPINLLPPEAAAKSKKRRRTLSLILLGVTYVALLALVAFWWQSKAASEEDALAEQQQANATLEGRVAQLSEASELRSRYEEGADRVADVLAYDISWGRILNDLGRIIPDRTWLTSFTGAAQFDEESPAGFGSIQTNGTAFDYPDAAAWLRALNSDRWPAIAGGWLQSSTRSELFEGVIVVDFTSVGTLTESALSNRADLRIPEVPE